MAFENAVQVISPFESFNAFAHAPRRLPDLIERFHQLEALEDEDQPDFRQ